MTAVAPIKKTAEPQAFGVGNKYSALLFKERSPNMGNHAFVAINKSVVVDTYIDGKVEAIVRCSPAHFRVELSNGQTFIVAEQAVQAAVELKAPVGPVAA